MADKIWDNTKNQHIETPDKQQQFLNDIIDVCKKHNLSIGHEGAFVIEQFHQFNIERLQSAIKGWEDAK